MFRTAQNAARRVTTETQRRTYTWIGNGGGAYRRLNGPAQSGQGAPYRHPGFSHGVWRSVLERSGWLVFFFLPLEAVFLGYEYFYSRVDTELGPWLTDLHRWDGTEYDEEERQRRFLWATDNTLSQYKNEAKERTQKQNNLLIAKLRLDER
eukprot:Hpha_TRINITY_DN13596_c0_g1::TRINITY_DN13596_c0_g1_i1::g.111593::m.111593